MDRLSQIKEPVREEFSRYEEFMRKALGSDSRYVEDIMTYIISARGKGIRPMLVFLTAGVNAAGRPPGERVLVSAMLVEMIHNASLVHDDVVDDSDMRHGKASVNRKWDTRVSVLAGDFILARSFTVGMESEHFDIVSYISAGVSDLAEGELIQNDINDRREMTRQQYLDIIFKKTATLLGVSCGVGAMAAGATEEDVARWRQIGLDLGMAFQIRDDILDYCPQEQTGKPFCADLRAKKITLPLLTIFERSDALTKKLIMGKIDCIDKDPSEINDIYEFVVGEGGISASEEVMYGYLERARKAISAYPDSPYRDSLLGLCDYIGDRGC